MLLVCLSLRVEARSCSVCRKCSAASVVRRPPATETSSRTPAQCWPTDPWRCAVPSQRWAFMTHLYYKNNRGWRSCAPNLKLISQKMSFRWDFVWAQHQSSPRASPFPFIDAFPYFYQYSEGLRIARQYLISIQPLKTHIKTLEVRYSIKERTYYFVFI